MALIPFNSSIEGGAYPQPQPFKINPFCFNTHSYLKLGNICLLLCECRILYKNQDMVTWVEEQFKLFFRETHAELESRTAIPEVKQAIQDLHSMVDL